MGRLPFQIKICGVTTAADAVVASEAGASAIGLNFYSQSKRSITHAEAMSTRSELAPSAIAVGVFVNPSRDEILAAHSNERLAQFGSEFVFEFFEGAPDKRVESRLPWVFDWIQLHGVETPEFFAQIKRELEFPVMRAFPWGPNAGNLIDEYLDRVSQLRAIPDAVLIDAHKPGEYGGTGETADWEAIAKWRESRRFDIPLVLAGGLTPENVARAIQMVRPDAVDTASGVESSPGRKDPARVRAFIAEAKRAFAAMS